MFKSKFQAALLVGFLIVGASAAGAFDLEEIYPASEGKKALVAVYQEVIDHLFEVYLIPILDDADQKILNIKSAQLTNSSVSIKNIPSITIENGEIRIPENFVLFIDDFIISKALLHAVGKPSTMTFDYIASLRCLRNPEFPTTVDQFIGFTKDSVALHEDDVRAVDLLLQTILLWLIAEQVAEDLGDQSPQAFAVELFRRHGFPPAGLSVYRRVLSMLADYDLGKEEADSGQYDEDTLAILRTAGGENRQLAAMIENHSESLSRVPGTRDWTERLVEDLYALGVELEQGKVLVVLHQACPALQW